MNDYALKQSAALGYGALHTGTHHLQDVGVACAPIKQTAIEDCISQVELMRQQLNLINCDVVAFLERVGGGALNSAESEKCNTQSPPQPSGQLPRLGTNLKELKYLLNTLGERVSKFNLIA